MNEIGHDAPMSDRYCLVDLCQREPSRALWRNEEYRFDTINAVTEWAATLPAGVAVIVEGPGHEYVLSGLYRGWRAAGRRAYSSPVGIVLSREPKPRCEPTVLPRLAV